MDLVVKILFWSLIGSTVLFLLIVFRGAGSAVDHAEKSRRAVRLGILIQSLGFVPAWVFRRSRVYPFGGERIWPDILIGVVCLALAVGAMLRAASAKRHLGKQWALAARTLEDHRLVTSGPFGRVRHPIYVSMGMLLLAAIAGLSSPVGAAGSILLFGIGTALRIRAEDSLLAETFGAEFEDYRHRVPAFFPRLGRTARKTDKNRNAD